LDETIPKSGKTESIEKAKGGKFENVAGFV
jgi:hypothetical protein